MGAKRLTPEEHSRGIEKIRKNYDHFRVRFITDGRERRSFEDRYLQALRNRTDMTAFIAAELELLRELTARAEERRRRKLSRKSRPSAAPDEPDFADRVIAELKKRVEKYPLAGLEQPELWEVDHLFGALMLLEREHWPKIERIYRRIYPSRYSGPRVLLENKLYELTEARADDFPKRLYALRELLGRFPRTLREIEWESKKCILQASFFLHTFDRELALLTDDTYIWKEERKTVETVHNFVHTVIEDFRLQDLKEQGHTTRS